MNSKTVTVEPNQTIYDIAMQHCGTAEAAFGIIRDNHTLQNDPKALLALGIDYIRDAGYWADVALVPGCRIVIDMDNPLVDTNTSRQITAPITTYNI